MATTKKFCDLKIGDVIYPTYGGIAKVLSCPGPAMPRGYLGVEIRIIDGDLEWCAMRPDTEVVMAEVPLTPPAQARRGK